MTIIAKLGTKSQEGENTNEPCIDRNSWIIYDATDRPLFFFEDAKSSDYVGFRLVKDFELRAEPGE